MLRAVTASGVSRTEGAWLLPTPVRCTRILGSMPCS
jgi:hypothetical protein